MNKKIILPFIIFIDFLFILYGVSEISISYKEAVVLYKSQDFLSYVVQFSTYIFGENDYALRGPFILMHLLSIILLYIISGYYLKSELDRLYSVIIFVLLPGVASSALVVTSSGLAIFFTLLFIYLFEEKKKYLYYPLIICLLIVDNSFFILYLALFSYGVYKNDKNLYILSAVLFIISLYLFGFSAGGRPQTYFLDTLAMYAVIFSPLLFLYFFYTLYRTLFKFKKTIIWFISFTALILSLIMSFRERISIVDFAPFVVISTPLIVLNFLNSYRVRLLKYRLPYKIALIITSLFLILNFLFTYFNKYLYLYDTNPQKHFAKKYHIVKELATRLKEIGINSVQCEDKKLALRLKFYQISGGDKYYLSTRQSGDLYKKVTISYISKPIKTYYVSKLHK